MSEPPALTIGMLIAAAKDQLGLSGEAADQLRPIFETQVQSVNRLRAIRVDATVEPDMVFHAEGDHD
jgi:hypothetical protein